VDETRIIDGVEIVTKSSFREVAPKLVGVFAVLDSKGRIGQEPGRLPSPAKPEKEESHG